MQELEIKINNGERSIQVEIADSWKKLTATQLLYIAANYRTWQFMIRNGESMLVARAKLFAVLILNKTALEIKEILNYLSNIDYEKQGINLLYLTDFVFNKNEGYFNCFPKVKISWFKHLYGPADRLSNISINEFSFALKHFNAFNTTKDEKHLDLLIACLYRPKQKDWEQFGDIRKPFGPFTAEKHIKQISKLDYEQKMAIYLFFSACMELISKLYAAVFNKVEQPENKPAGVPQSFTDIILKLSGGKFGSFNETKDQNAHLVLKELNQLIIDSDKKPK
jgi:hypothetical protein